jgi:hypothetical protein
MGKMNVTFTLHRRLIFGNILVLLVTSCDHRSAASVSPFAFHLGYGTPSMNMSIGIPTFSSTRGFSMEMTDSILL